MKFETFEFSRDDGPQIITYRWLPGESIELKGVLQIAHGMAEHARRYDRFAQSLVDTGFVVYANDHRGHGKTAGSIENIGYLADENGWQKVVEDLHQLSRIIKENHPNLPLFLLGHSFGSFLARNYICLYAYDLQGVILSGTSGIPGVLGALGVLVSKLEMIRIGQKKTSPFLHQMAFGNFNNAFKPSRTDLDWLSRDEAEVDQYVADPYCGTVFTAGFYHDLLTGLQVINRIENISKIPKNLPIYLFSGDKDPVGAQGKGVLQTFQGFQEAGIQDVSYKLYPDGRHEMLNETNRKEVIQEVVVWLEKHLPQE